MTLREVAITRAGARGAPAAFAAVLLCASSAHAWGLATHRWVALRAAELVRDRCPTLAAAPPSVLGQAAVEPDTLLKRLYGRGELVRHFLNLDHYGPPPFRALPRDRALAESRFGRGVVEREGILPWHGADVARRLRDELGRGDLPAARITAGYLAHYAADATMPLHATEDYDGRRTKQAGIHRRVEAQLVDADLGEYARRAARILQPRRAIRPEGATGALFAALEQAYGEIPPLLAADRDARRGTRVGSRVYYRRMHAALVDRLAAQIAAAVTLTAALWEGACVHD